MTTVQEGSLTPQDSEKDFERRRPMSETRVGLSFSGNGQDILV